MGHAPGFKTASPGHHGLSELGGLPTHSQRTDPRRLALVRPPRQSRGGGGNHDVSKLQGAMLAPRGEGDAGVACSEREDSAGRRFW